MTLHQLRAFTLVAELGSYKDAAEAFEVSRPCMTFLIKGLEKEYQLKLFNRVRNRTVLSSSGEVLLQKAKKVLDDTDQLEEEVNNLKGLVKGKLLVGGSSIAASSFFPVAIQEFKKEHLGIDVPLVIDRSRNLEKKLLEGEIDLAILGWDARSPALLAEPFRKEKVVFIAPPNHPLAKKCSVSLELIAREPLIIHQSGTRTRDLVEQMFAKKRLTCTPFIEINRQQGSREAIEGAVANGLGIGVDFMGHVLWNVKAGRLKLLKVPELNIERTMHIAYHQSRQTDHLVQSFIQFLQRYKRL